MTHTQIVWNGCDGYAVSNDSVFTQRDEFKPFEVIRVDVDDLPKDADGEPILDQVYFTEDGKAYKEIEGK